MPHYTSAIFTTGRFFQAEVTHYYCRTDMVVVTDTSHDLIVFTIRTRKNILKTALAEVSTPETSAMVTGVKPILVQFEDGILVTGKGR